MNDKKNEYFLKVCETGNITTAADELYVSRSVLSRALRELEDEFNTTLFTRSKQGVELTDGGVIIRDMMQSVASNYKYALKRLQEVKKDSATEKIRVGVTPTNAFWGFKRFFGPFMQEHPEIQLYIEEHSAFDMCQLIMDRTLDVGITPTFYGADFIDSFQIYEDTLVLGMRKSDPLAKKKEVSLSDIADLPLGFLSAKVPMEGIVNEYVAAQHKTANVVVRTSDMELLHYMTLRGYVYPFLTRDIMSNWKDLSYRKVSFVTPSQVKMLWPRQATSRPAMRTFIDYMKVASIELSNSQL